MSLDVEKLKQNNNELREIVNNSWDGIAIIDKNSKFIYVNSAFSPILGFTKNEFLNSNFTSYIINEDKDKFLEAINKNLINKYSSEVQVICTRKDNQKVYLQITLSLMLNKEFFVVNAKDITKQISDDEILNNYVISSHINLDGNIVTASKALSMISGYKKEELIGRPFLLLKDKNEIDKLFNTIIKSIKLKKQWNGKIHNIKKDGSAFWVNATVKPIFNKYGDVTGYTILMFDITNELLLKDDKKILTEEVHEAQNEINQKNKILVQQSKLAIMAETLQMVSHEWRQPLNIISIQAQKVELDYSINDNMDPQNVIEVLNNIKQKANELSQTIEDFQSFINIRNEKKPANPLDIIDQAIKIFKNDPQSEDIDFLKETVNTPNFKTYSNELTTILVNILINAKEAIFRNKTKTGVIKLKEYYDKNKIYFEVSDNGGGVNEEIIDKIFEPYFSTKDAQHGVGLGLYMCKIIIEMHFSGTIEINNHNTGATFKIALPMN